VLKHLLIIVVAAALAGCTQPEPAGLAADTAGDNGVQTGRYVLTVAEDEAGGVSSERMQAVVKVLQSHDAKSVEVLEGLPTIIVTATPGAIAAAEETGLLLAVQADGLSAPQ